MSNKRLIDVLDETSIKEDEVRQMVINKLKKLYDLIVASPNFEDTDFDFVSSLTEDRLGNTERKITRIELEKCNELYTKYRNRSNK
ncbi:MAG: hypothetical protein H8D94_01985 [Candidatus Pelagibacter sp.]|nr:hypothetical protein [Candidatus Pelagibacter sp.]